MNIENQNKLRQIANYYGLAWQEGKLIEELGELIVAVSKDFQNKALESKLVNKLSRSVIEELADVKIMIEQIEYLTDSGLEVEEQINKKLERQLDRVNTEKSKRL